MSSLVKLREKIKEIKKIRLNESESMFDFIAKRTEAISDLSKILNEESLELKCPIPLCDFKPRSHKNDNPDSAKLRFHGHLFLKHSKGELIRTIFILVGWEEEKDSDIWPPIKYLDRRG